MALTQEQITVLEREILTSQPMGSALSYVGLRIPAEEYNSQKRDECTTQEFWEWNLTYMLLLLESDGE